MLNRIETIPLSKLENNNGQIEGLPKNPRILKDDSFKKLCKSLQEDPEMLELRELIVYPLGSKFIVIAGNMRLQAMRELKFKEAHCKVLDESTPIDKLKAYTVKDNVSGGLWDFDMLANEWDLDMLEDWGVDVPGVDLDIIDNENVQTQDDNLTIKITFDTHEDMKGLYSELMGRGYMCKKQ